MEIHVHVHHHEDRDTRRQLDRIERGIQEQRETLHEISCGLRDLAARVGQGEVPDDLYARLASLADRTRLLADKTPNFSPSPGGN